nr:G protein-coupled receptor [Proales similis]
MNSTEEQNQMDSLELPIYVLIYGTIFYILIFFIGILGNSLVIYILSTEKEARNFTNYLLANLSFADLLVLITCLPPAIHDLYAKERWYLGKPLCFITYFSQNCMSLASILSILAITCERFYVICHPLQVKSVITFKSTLMVVALIWTVSIITNLPLIYLTDYSMGSFYDEPQLAYQCSANVGHGYWRIYFVFTSFIIYFLIGILLLVMYYKITKNLNESTKLLILTSNRNLRRYSHFEDIQTNLLALSQQLEPKGANVPAKRKSTIGNLLLPPELTDLAGMEELVKPRRQLIILLMCVIIIFYVCLFPLRTWNIFLLFYSHQDWFREKISLRTYLLVSITTRLLFYTNSFVNPILYNCLSKKFRKSFRNLLTCQVKSTSASMARRN